MATFRIDFSDDEVEQIKKRARELGISPEELLQRRVRQWLQRPDIEFADAASYVLNKNSDLYKRLS